MQTGGNGTLEEAYRVVLVHRDRFLVRKGEEEHYCVLSGSLRCRDEYPVVGDLAEIAVNPCGDSLIRSILPRRTVFCRPERGGHADGYAKALQVQPLVANIDYVFIITSLDRGMNMNRIARYAALAVSGGAAPVAVLTKADIGPNAEEIENEVSALSRGLRAIAVSARTGYGMERLDPYRVPGTTIALLGSSGAGKSTLVNALAGREIMRTGDVRESDSKGRHTTTHRELIDIGGVSFIDTPGLREVGMIDAEEGIAGTFSDIAELIGRCAFRDCTHTNEPGCAVRAALRDGSLSPERWETYSALERENAHSMAMKREKMKGIALERRKLNKSNRKR